VRAQARSSSGSIRCSRSNSTLEVGGYSLAIAIGAVRGVTAPEICDAIRKAATTAGTLINLRN
jgi:hypothetical protein